MYYSHVVKQCIVVVAMCFSQQLIYAIPVSNDTGKGAPAPIDGSLQAGSMGSIISHPNLVLHKNDSSTTQSAPVDNKNEGKNLEATKVDSKASNVTVTASQAPHSTSDKGDHEGNKDDTVKNSSTSVPVPGSKASVLFPTYENFRG